MWLPEAFEETKEDLRETIVDCPSESEASYDVNWLHFSQLNIESSQHSNVSEDSEATLLKKDEE